MYTSVRPCACQCVRVCDVSLCLCVCVRNCVRACVHACMCVSLWEYVRLSVVHVSVRACLSMFFFVNYLCVPRPTLWKKMPTRFNFTKTSTKPCTHLGKPFGHCSVTKY